METIDLLFLKMKIIIIQGITYCKNEEELNNFLRDALITFNLVNKSNKKEDESTSIIKS
jgi:hypothetical protein